MRHSFPFVSFPAALPHPHRKAGVLREWIGMEWVLDKSVFDFSLFGKLVFDISLFNCVGFSDVGLPGVGFSNIGLPGVGFSNPGEWLPGDCGCS